MAVGVELLVGLPENICFVLFGRMSSQIEYEYSPNLVKWNFLFPVFRFAYQEHRSSIVHKIEYVYLQQHTCNKRTRLL